MRMIQRMLIAFSCLPLGFVDLTELSPHEENGEGGLFVTATRYG
jgi:hypothetical protein